MARPGISQLGTFDVLLELHDGAAATTSSGTGQVNSAARVVDLYQGASIGDKGVGAEFHGDLQIDASNVKVSAANELYSLVLEGCNAANFASNIAQLGVVQLGNATAMLGNTDLNVAGAGTRIIRPFRNELNGVTYRYVRLAMVLAGTSPSITFTARMNKPSV